MSFLRPLFYSPPLHTKPPPPLPPPTLGWKNVVMAWRYLKETGRQNFYQGQTPHSCSRDCYTEPQETRQIHMLTGVDFQTSGHSLSKNISFSKRGSLLLLLLGEVQI